MRTAATTVTLAAMAHEEQGTTGDEEFLLRWTEALTGLEPERVQSARREIASWGIEHVTAELLAESVDAAVAATLLVEGVEKLAERRVPRKRFHKKLRQDREVWGTFAEIRAADMLLRSMDESVELRLEEGRSQGAHADLRFMTPDSASGHSIEVKAIGLSDEEVRFCERMAPSLPQLSPPTGLAHVHAPIGGAPPRLSRAQRREGARRSRRAARRVPTGYPRGLRGAVIVGHGSEQAYARRVSGRVVQAVRQLPQEDECWVAMYWSNGAPIQTVRAALRWEEIPAHVVGIIFVGCGVAFPQPQIHCYASWLHREADENTEMVIASLEEGQDDLAALVLRRFERSSGVRATLLKAYGRTVLLRDGRRRILPFNLLMDADPPELGREARDAPWMR